MGGVLALAVILALPFILRPRPETTGEAPSDIPARKVTIISPHWEGVRREFSRAFSEWTLTHLGHATRIEWLDVGGTSDAIRYIRSEFKRVPEGIGVDMFFGGGIDPYLQLKAAGLLEPLVIPEEVLSHIPPDLFGVEVYDPERTWFGVCLGGFGIIYNRRVLEILQLPEPVQWTDLKDPRFFSWVGSGDPRSSGSVHMAYEIILQAHGWQEGWALLMQMCGNIRNFSRAASDVPKDTAIGEVACGLAIDVYAWRQVAEAGADRIGFVLPEHTTVVNPDGIGVLKGAPARDLAEHFVAFCLSEQGQNLWILPPGAPGGPHDFPLSRIPVRPSVLEQAGDKALVAFNPSAWKGGMTYDAEKGSLRWTLLNDLIGACMIDTHQDLISAWKRIQSLAPEDPLRIRFLSPPVPEAQALQWAADAWQDPQMRARIRSEWTAEARARYRDIARSPL